MGVPGSVNNLLGISAGGYQVSRSIRLNSADSATLTRTAGSPSSSGTWTLSVWIKRAKITTNTSILGGRNTGGAASQIFFTGSDTLRWYENGADFSTTAVFRDAAAWYNFVFTKNGTTSCTIYVNGSQLSQTTSSIPSASPFNSNGSSLYIGVIPLLPSGEAYYADHYFADIHFIDGQALTPGSFGETDATTGVWNPKAFSGSYGTNGFHLEFADNSSTTNGSNVGIGKDTSGNGNYWNSTNLSVTAGAGNDSLVDVPTNGAQTDTGVGGEVRGNYCTLNPLDYGSRSTSTFANGNLDVSNSNGTSADSLYRGTFGVSSGKWYFEALFSTMYSTEAWVGIAKGAESFTLKTSSNPYYNGSLVNYLYRANGNKETNSGSATSYGASWTTNDVIGVALDLDNGTLTFYKNGSSQGSAFTSITGTWFPCILNGGGNSALIANFGQRAFAYTAPSGFKALCTANLPEPTIKKPSTAFQTLVYSGTSATQAVSGLGFSNTAGLIWVKNRTDNLTQYVLQDIVRTYATGKKLGSSDTAAEGDATVFSDSFGYISAASSTGFTLDKSGTGASDWSQVNLTGKSYAAWCWDAGSFTDTNNTAGTITPAGVRANTSAGFSIVTYTGNGSSTGATVGHGLGVEPSFFIIKNRSASSDWVGYHKSVGSGYFLILNSTSAAVSSAMWDGAPSSTVLKLNDNSGGTFTETNTNGQNYVAYCFAPVAGFSAFGSYTGNGLSDGPFMFTGFRPRWVLIKISTGSTNNWRIYDTARNEYNVTDNVLAPNTTDNDSASATNILDILSNGFKIRGTGPGTNTNASTYIWAAFAESPLKYSRAR